MTKMNVQAKFNGGKVHTGAGTADIHGAYSPACGTQRYAGGGRTPNPLYLTDAPVDCKKCLKRLSDAEIVTETHRELAERVESEKAEAAPEIKPGRCLQRFGKVGANLTQCVKAHAHEDDHQDQFGYTYGNHLVVPTADPLSPTAQAVLDANRVWEEAMTDAWRSEGTERQEEADAAYEAAEKALREAREAHHAARKAAGDFLPREQREAREAQPFTYSYDATAGVLVADALRTQAQEARRIAADYRKMTGNLTDFYAEQARVFTNKATLLEAEADKIHKPVRDRISADAAQALARSEEPRGSRAARRIQDAIGLTW